MVICQLNFLILKKASDMIVVYFSNVRYPTEKAYGVTIFYTMQALEELGHKSMIISPSNFNEFGRSQISRLILKYFWNKTSLINSKSRLIDKQLFIIKRIILALYSRYLIPSTTDTLWIRDPLIGLLNYKKSNIKKVVVEVHLKPHSIDLLLLKLMQKSGKLVIAPISVSVEGKLRLSRINLDHKNTVLAPMAVPNAFFENQALSEFIKRSNFRLSYVGSIFSTGHDQKIYDLISDIEKINNSENNFKIQVYLYGIEDELIPAINHKFSKLSRSDQLFIYPRQSHEILLTQLIHSDAFILPYPDGIFFEDRFPLKALEYAALRRPILVSDTVSHRNIFSDDEVWFYEFGNYASLTEAISNLILNPTLAKNKLELAFSKAKNYTYINRVKKILEVF